jgi:uncharacterized protein YpuA (DUF1002 family)
MNYNYTDEQRQETIKLLLVIQRNLPWKKARCECEQMNEAIKGIYEILDMVQSQETVQKIYNPVTKKYYNIRKRSSVYDGEVKGLWHHE